MENVLEKNVEREDLINELILVKNIMGMLWDFHPENPEHVNLVNYYNELKEQSIELEKQLA
jgi:hypothetical protein